jgi:hypothetical protein
MLSEYMESYRKEDEAMFKRPSSNIKFTEGKYVSVS